MPPRLNKRQQREQEELLALTGTSNDVQSSIDDAEDSEVPIKSGAAGFAALYIPEEEIQEESPEESPSLPSKSRKSKKKKKKDSVVAAAQVREDQSTSLPPSTHKNVPKQSRKAVKKGKGKEKPEDEGKDDLDKALAELSVKYPELRNIAATTSTAASSFDFLAPLLSVSLLHLDSEAEMRKFFGSKVVSANKSSSPNPSPRRQAGALRSNLTRPQPQWWAAKQREGLSIRTLTTEEVAEKLERMPLETAMGEKWWTVEYSKKYKGMTMAFMETVLSGNPEGFWALTQKLPWHADTLLQLSEVYRHREEYSQATDFVNRALFAYERSFIGTFNFTSGLNRLDFDHVENRPFFLAIHRQVIDLQRRGCVRTSFEFAKLLYSLDPTDPHGALFHLDYLAIKAGMFQWLLDVWNYFDAKRIEKQTNSSRVNVTTLPGWAYARALALRASEGNDHSKSQAALEDAINAFPMVVPLLADKIELSLSADVRGKSEFRVHTDSSTLGDESLAILHLLSHLYAQRSSFLWKDPALSSWLANTVTSLLPSLPPPSGPHELYRQFVVFYGSAISRRFSIWRHVMVMESNYRMLISFIPTLILDAKSLACDPLPPMTMVNIYDEEFFRGAEDVFSVRTGRRRNQAANERMLERLIPDPVFREQLQAFFDAHPAFAVRFPDGIVQFAQAVGQLPPDVLEDMMVAEIGAMGAGGGRGMPGEMPGHEILEFPLHDEDELDVQDLPVASDAEEIDEENIEDEISGDEEEVVPLPLRFLRGIVTRFWGATQEDPSSEDEGPPAVDDGVD